MTRGRRDPLAIYIAFLLFAVLVMAGVALYYAARNADDQSDDEVQNESRLVLVTPFGSVGHICDGSGHRVFVSNEGQMEVVDDPVCAGEG